LPDPEATGALIVLGQIHDELAEYADAERAFERAVSAGDELPPSPAHDQLRVAALVALGNARRIAGRYNDAERVLRQALTFAEETLRATDMQVAGALNALAVTFKYSGRFEEAEPLLHRALEINEDTLGPDHPDAATLLHNLGGLHHARRDYAAASCWSSTGTVAMSRLPIARTRTTSRSGTSSQLNDATPSGHQPGSGSASKDMRKLLHTHGTM
jgi:tetratricopeptide (TPR) repeat protein